MFIILFLLVGVGNIQTIFKINKQAPLPIEFSGILSFWANWMGEEFLFGRLQEWGATFSGSPQEHLAVTRDEKLFVKYEIILPLLCFLLDHFTNKHSRTWSCMINLWIDSRTYQKQRILLSKRSSFHTASGQSGCYQLLF